eukprot:COSAG06_NODE_66_length_26393_cov_6.455161_25_plen_94_part_00
MFRRQLTNYHGSAQQPGEACDEQLPEPGLPHFIDKTGSIEAEWGWFGDAAATSLEFVNATLGAQARKTRLLKSHLYIKTIFLPRQARDKHRES